MIAWSSNLWNWQSTCSNRHCFYLKKKKRCKHAGVTHLSGRNKATSASDRRPSALWVLSSAGKLIRSDIYNGSKKPHRSADVFLFCFYIRYLYLSVTQLGCSLNVLSGEKSLSSISWLDTPLTANWLQVFVFGPVSFLKCFWKIAYPTFKTWSTRRGSDTYLLQTLYGHIKLCLWG